VIASWTITGADGATGEELLVAFDQVRPVRVLVCPAWFDEANKLRRFTVEVMRRLDKAGIDSFLPDLPGCNDSLAPLEVQTLAGWKAGMTSAAHFFRADLAGAQERDLHVARRRHRDLAGIGRGLRDQFKLGGGRA
jgi:hypothetical protein